MQHNTLYAIGEALIDFTPNRVGCAFAEVEHFSPSLGGAPANVCAAFTRLGGRSELITQLGDDPFGHKIKQELDGYGVGTQHIRYTNEACTALAFVSLQTNGQREFSFYRKPSADMLLPPSYLEKDWFANAFALHFCSVSLCDAPMRESHRTAIQYVLESGAMISFDPNLRFSLWEDTQALKDIVLEFLPYAHVLKISDEEVEFLTGTNKIEDALPKLFVGNVSLILYTCGAKGAWAFTKNAQGFAASQPVKAVDTTGAGDAFAGAFLHSLAEQEITPQMLAHLSQAQLEEYLAFSNRYCGESVTQYGTISSYPTREMMK